MNVRWCGKQRHPSQGKADAALRSLVARGLDRPEEGPIRVYFCGRCHAWHTGHWTPVRLESPPLERVRNKVT